MVSPWDGVSCGALWWFEPRQERRRLSSLPAAAPRTSVTGRSEWVLVWKAPGSPREAGTVLSTRERRCWEARWQSGVGAVSRRLSVCLSHGRLRAGLGEQPHI